MGAAARVGGPGQKMDGGKEGGGQTGENTMPLTARKCEDQILRSTKKREKNEVP